MKYNDHFDSKLSSLLLRRLKFNFLSASLQWHIPPCTPSHIVFVLVSPLPFPQSLFVNYTLKWLRYYIYIVQTSIANISASPKPLARRRLSVCLSPTHRQTHRRTYLLSFQPLSLCLGCGYHFSPLALIILSYSLPCINPGIFILHHISRPHFPALVHTYGCSPPSGLLLQSSPKVITRHLSGSQGARGKEIDGRGARDGTEKMSVFEKPPGVGNSPAKSPHFPRFSSSVCTVSHIVSPLLSPLLPLSLSLSSPHLHPSLPWLPLSVLLCLLLSCIALPAM